MDSSFVDAGSRIYIYIIYIATRDLKGAGVRVYAQPGKTSAIYIA